MTLQKEKTAPALNLKDFFQQISNTPYVIVRGLPDGILDYRQGSDIDIFCYDKDFLGQELLKFSNDYVRDGFHLEVDNVNYDHTHVDFVRDGKLELRFDLYGELPKYKKSNVNNCLFFSIIENAQTVEASFRNDTVSIQIPSEIDDLLLRYLEYIEYYEQRPDKVKHLDYILQKVENLPDRRIGFLDKLHCYTDLPKCSAYAPPHMPPQKKPKKPGRVNFNYLKNLADKSIKRSTSPALYKKIKKLYYVVSKRF
jgi:hypothetical protein